MNTSPKHPDNSLTPPDNLRCVWMTAGILSYHLCDRDFDCDRCPLDVAMRKHFSNEPDSSTEGGRSTVPEAIGLRSDRRYSLKHCWIKPWGERVQQIGIEPSLAGALLRPKAVVLPTVGEPVTRNQTCLWIVLDGGTYPVDSPISGTVLSTNAKLKQNPLELFFHPLDEGWLINLEAASDSDEMKQLLSVADAEQIFARDASLFRELLIQEMKENRPAVGITLPDGGELLRTVSNVVGPKKYFTLVLRSFR